MRVVKVLHVALLAALSGCSAHTTDAPVSPARSAADSALAPNAVAASYEVRIASAQADRVQALEACDSQPKAERAACHREADSAYETARADAEKFRDSTQ